MLKIIFMGDVCGSVGRDVLKRALPDLKNHYKPDLVIANVENSAGGYGITGDSIQEVLNAGVDLCTGGDHTFSIKTFAEDLQDDLPFIRPANYEARNLPGRGFEIIDLGGKGRVGIVNILGQDLFTHNPRVRSPFWFADELLENPELKSCDLIAIDFHAESTAEKLCFAWYVRDRVETVVGTHTHVATADNRLLTPNLAYVSDLGQVGPYNASLWVNFESAIHNFKYPTKEGFYLEEQGPKILNAVLVSYETSSSARKRYSPHKIERIDVVLDS